MHELAKRLVDAFEVTVLCPHARGAAARECMDGVQVIRYRYAPERLEVLVNDGGIVNNLRRRPWTALLVPAFVLCQAVALAALVRRWRPEVIHAHWLVPQGFLAAALRGWGGTSIPYLVTSHGADLFALRGRATRWMKRFAARRAACVAVVSEGMREEAVRAGVAPTALRVMPMGVDLEHRYVPDPTVARRKDELLFVGRLVEKKGLDVLVSAMPEVLARRPDASLRVFGFGPEEARCRSLVAALRLSDVVTFEGPATQDLLPAAYRRAALFVAPFMRASSGDQDGLGLVLIEALGCGCPVVVSELPATRGLASTASGIATVPPGCPDRLARKLVELLESPPPCVGGVDAYDWRRRAADHARVLKSILPAGHGE
ncbi:glycosyltransferase [Marilutibacter spongiae]|uniref:glycosyltransferase n=1 Tax=Marilutibacter spongiae TaxID=2025720 RepID=UPI0031B5A408